MRNSCQRNTLRNKVERKKPVLKLFKKNKIWGEGREEGVKEEVLYKTCLDRRN